MKILRNLIVIALAAIVLTLIAGSADAADSLKVGVKESPPFAELVNDQWSGDSIDIVQGIAQDLGTAINYVSYNTVDDLLEAAEAGKVDLAISAITVTSEREERVDFSMPYKTTNIGVLTNAKSNVGEIIKSNVIDLLMIVGVFVLFCYAVGFLAALADKDHSIKNIHLGAYWALVTSSTVGYGDLVPKGAFGKLLTSILIVVGIILFSVFTGYISSTLTVTQISESPTTISDLNNAKVAAIQNTTGASFLEDRDIEFESFTTLNEALERFFGGDVEAVVYDSALLETAAEDADDYRVWPLSQNSDYYAIAFPEDSDLQESVNRSIIRQIRN